MLILKTKRDEYFSSSSALKGSPRDEMVSLAVVTPTHHREKDKNFQTHALLALKNTLCSSSVDMDIVWVLVESESDWRKSPLVERYEKENRPLYCQRVHVKALRVSVRHTKNGHRGVSQRNKALDWLQMNPWLPEQNPVVLFADDDNAYTTEHFVRASKVRKVGIWPVGFPGTTSKFEAPFVKGQNDAMISPSVVGFRSFWCGNLAYKPRIFNVDMAGFGVRLNAIGSIRFDETAHPGYLEDMFLQRITRNIHKRNNTDRYDDNDAFVLLDALETVNADDGIFVWHLYHKVTPGKTSSVKVLTRVPKGISFLCPPAHI